MESISSSPYDLRQKWREERAFRLGVRLAKATVFICILPMILNFIYAGPLEVAADVFLIAGAALSLHLTNRQKPRPYFVWWPIYIGYLCAIVPSTWLSGGIYSPWLGCYLAVFAVVGTMIQYRLTPLRNFAVIIAYVLGWLVAERFLPNANGLKYVEGFPPHFMAIAILIFLFTVAYCLHRQLRTEGDLSLEVEQRYAELFETRAQLLREETANQAKSTFLANISHELRTPLGAVLGYADLLQNKDSTPEEKERFAQTIERNGRQLARLVDDLLDFSKIEAGHIEVENLEAPLDGMIGDVIEMLKVSAKRKNIAVRVNFASPLPARILTDPVRFKQIFTNILGNAIKFTDGGEITVRLTEVGGNILAISVRDQGRGIAPSERDKLFQPFSQADASMTRKYGGTGLGLSFSRKLAQLMGGGLDLTWSQLGSGSEFTIQLPLRPASSELIHRLTATDLGEMGTLSPGFDFSGLKILVVDDSPDNRDILRLFLSPTGARIEEACDGEECIRKVEENQFDMVLMDIQMPRLDGLQASTILRRRDFNRPIIAISAHAMKEDRDRCLKAGCDSHLTKPLKKHELMETVQQFRTAHFI